MALFVYVVEQRLPRELKRTRFATRHLLRKPTRRVRLRNFGAGDGISISLR